MINAAGDALWMFGLSFVGLALFAYFAHHHAAAGVCDRQDPAATSCRRRFRPAPSAW